MKKIVLSVMCFLLVTSLFTSCGKSDETSLTVTEGASVSEFTFTDAKTTEHNDLNGKNVIIDDIQETDFLENVTGTEAGQVLSVTKLQPNNTGFLAETVHLSAVPQGYIGIYSADELNLIRNNTNMNYILMNDIDLSGYSVWSTIEQLNGTFDGNGYSITGLQAFEGVEVKRTIGANSFYYGIFGTVQEIKNLCVKDVNIRFINEKNAYGRVVGILAASAQNISNCYVTGNIVFDNVSNIYVGALCSGAGNAEFCYSNTDIQVSNCANISVGGLIGTVNTIKNCYNEGNISVSSPDTEYLPNDFAGYGQNETMIGGISAYGQRYEDNLFESCYNCGDITIEEETTTCCGGIVACSYDGTYKYCYNTGKITVTVSEMSESYNRACIGGIASGDTYQGEEFGVYNCYNSGDIIVKSSEEHRAGVGGIVGNDFYHTDERRHISIKNCFNSGEVSLDCANNNSFCGGIAGNAKSIISCYNIGIVSSVNEQTLVGALSGGLSPSESTVLNSYFTNINISATGVPSLFENVRQINENELENPEILIGFDFSSKNDWGYQLNSSYKYPIPVGVYCE